MRGLHVVQSVGAGCAPACRMSCPRCACLPSVRFVLSEEYVTKKENVRVECNNDSVEVASEGSRGDHPTRAQPGLVHSRQNRQGKLCRLKQKGYHGCKESKLSTQLQAHYLQTAGQEGTCSHAARTGKAQAGRWYGLHKMVWASQNVLCWLMLQVLRKSCSVEPRAPPKHHTLEQRVATQPVCAVHAACGRQAVDGRGARLGSKPCNT